jgi:hypothetical protein
MCKFFSVRSDGAGKVYYLNAEQRAEARKNGNNPDSHTFIAEYYGFKGNDEDMLNAYEYNFATKELVVDRMLNKDDSILVKSFIESLDEKSIAPQKYWLRMMQNRKDDLIGKTLRIKTTEEFLSQYGQRWMDDIEEGWNYQMDYLFGKEFVVDHLYQGSFASTNNIENHWSISLDMLTGWEGMVE